MNSNLHIDSNLNDLDMASYGVNAMSMASPGDHHSSFVQQLHDVQAYPADGNMMPDMMGNYDPMGTDANGKNRNRGNYRCSKCGEPKKGHVCPLVPANFKCARCGLTKKACVCEAPSTRSIGIQVEMDEDMTTRALDLSVQGIIEFQTPAGGYPSPSGYVSPSGFPSPVSYTSPPSSAYASPVSYATPPRSAFG
ncbi:hypothetical protein Poli38472_008331 [Pythium oligandrum]|uniref:Uncharacterized protein n=1 Tax=Pythium oligandrum TaxID=41045 RepID=A0A8K1CMA5_PYTOL|nr:hypothetical protein Poli38472_008331 [Pythium oligandrum]|eukprot:TMW65689.1 hypothetical protein Poli38472_008331 [Pythium oligandrum]